jgi:hypothetical protein
MDKILSDNNLTDSLDSLNDNLRTSSELNSTLKKCQSLITLQRIMILRSNPESKQIDKQTIKDLENNYKMEIDITNKQNPEVINDKLKKFFNMNNYEKNIKKVAWQKDLSKIYLGLNDDKDNKNNEFAEYNFEKREKKKEGLMFLKNFFGQLKSVKKDKFSKKKDKSKEKVINLNKYEKYYFHNRNKEKKHIDNEELDSLLNRLKIKYSPQKKLDEKMTIENIKNNNNKFLTEINNSSYNFNDKIHKNDFRKQKLFYSNYHLNEFSKKFMTENNKNNKINNNKLFFPKIKSSYDIEKNISKTIVAENRTNKNKIKNIKGTISGKNIFKNQAKLNKGINRNKTYLEQLKNIYKGENKNRYREFNNNINNFEMPELLIYKEKPLFKKNNQLFFSPLHYSKYEQMRDIRDKLTGVTGLMDKEVFNVYNKNI